MKDSDMTDIHSMAAKVTCGDGLREDVGQKNGRVAEIA